MMLKYFFAALFGLIPPTTATADEVWTTARGDLVYESDFGDTAILSLPDGASRVWLYLPGLGGNFSNRSTHQGYWLDERPGDCGAMLYGPDGRGSRHWGRVTVLFDQPAFPSDLSLWLGDCFEQPTQPVRGLSGVQ